MPDFNSTALVKEESWGFNVLTTSGVLVVSGAANEQGGYVELISAAENTSPSVGIEIILQQNFNVQVSDFLLLNVAVGEAGSEQVKVPLLFYYTDNSLIDQSDSIVIPIFIPAEVRISISAQSGLGSTSIPASIRLRKGNFNSNTPYNKVVALGANTSTSLGTQVTSGGLGVLGAWQEIVSATAEEYRGFFVIGINPESSWTTGTIVFNVGIGPAGSERAISENNLISQSSVEISCSMISQFKEMVIPTGSRLSIQSSANSNNLDFNLSYIIYGVK